MKELFDQLCDLMAPICRPYVKAVLEQSARDNPVTKEEVHAFVNGLMECEELGAMFGDIQKEAAEVVAAIETEDFNSLSEDYIDEEALILARQLISHWTVSLQLAMEEKTEIELNEEYYPKDRESDEELDLIVRRNSLTRQDVRDLMQQFLSSRCPLRIDDIEICEKRASRLAKR